VLAYINTYKHIPASTKQRNVKEGNTIRKAIQLTTHT